MKTFQSGLAVLSTAMFTFTASAQTQLSGNESPTIQYEVRGEVSWIGRDGKFVEGGKRTSGFTVCVKGSQWSVTVFPSNWPTRIRFDKEVPVPLSSTISSDGTNGYHLE